MFIGGLLALNPVANKNSPFGRLYITEWKGVRTRVTVGGDPCTGGLAGHSVTVRCISMISAAISPDSTVVTPSRHSRSATSA